MISTNKSTNKLFFNSQSSLGKQVLGYLKASDHELLTIDILQTKVTGTQWKELADGLHKTIGELIDKHHPIFTENYDEDLDLDENDWIKILNKHPEVLAYPILIFGEKYLQLNNPSDIVKYLDADSEAIDENKYI
ncbi:arsenate reductase family protein [Mangrovimonas sp. ST2L15]|uniref:arsenate reductase family protein n=1 Tax=Mangrovimonas sp. ST2L15 TaxID=1645916 RepID=UPI0012FC4CCD|nr:hypothetical protein [Mangrovimonas sp. ST2L15]